MNGEALTWQTTDASPSIYSRATLAFFVSSLRLLSGVTWSWSPERG